MPTQPNRPPLATTEQHRRYLPKWRLVRERLAMHVPRLEAPLIRPTLPRTEE
jgi:hypothetical protein